MASRVTLGVALVGWLALAGCDVFDEQLEDKIEQAEGDGDGDGDGDAPPLMLSDACEGNRPVVTSGLTKLVIPVTGLSPNVGEIEGCAVQPDVLARADGFFQIEARAGQRWHFHLDASPGQNLAVVALANNCDSRNCVAADVCRTSESEHFTFIPEVAGTYAVMVEGIDTSVDADLKLLAISPVCGDRDPQHGEVCDDGNLVNGDGCDNACRQELRTQTSEEKEPNDDNFLANVLVPARLDQPIVVRGKIAGGACQPDYYLLRIDTPQRLEATVLQASGGACAMAPAMELQLYSSNDGLRESVRLQRVPTTDGSCPAFEQLLDPGAYFIRLHHQQKSDEFAYQLSLTLSDPASGD
jgi:cysteine-rich repeat protein